jgi:hypothetical protein
MGRFGHVRSAPAAVAKFYQNTSCRVDAEVAI